MSVMMDFHSLIWLVSSSSRSFVFPLILAAGHMPTGHMSVVTEAAHPHISGEKLDPTSISREHCSAQV